MCTVEVRVPTYRRPRLLRRALESLLSQTFWDWSAFVLDDSPDREAEEIVNGINDSRIVYVQNDMRMGAAANLDKAFKSLPMASGEFAFVLEDDDALLPAFIESNIQLMDEFGVNLMLRNQAIYEQWQGEWRDTRRTTKSRLYDDKYVYSPIEIHATVFLNDCIANGGLFWRTTAIETNLQVGNTISDSGLQEYCRTIQIRDDLLFANEPLGIWTRIPNSEKMRSRISDRRFGRAVMSLRSKLLAKYGDEIVVTAQAIAGKKGLSKDLRHALVESFYMPEVLSALAAGQNWVGLSKALAKYLFVPDSIGEYSIG